MKFNSLRLAVLAAALPLSACLPPSIKINPAYLPVAKQYYSGCEWGADCSAAADALPIDQLYAAHLYGKSFHPWRSASEHIARRGAEAVPFLRDKLALLRPAASRNVLQIYSIFEIFTDMQESRTFDVRTDPALVALIQDVALAGDDGRGFILRDEADELETGERRPFSAVVVGRKWLHGHADDYDVKFAKSHCRRCDFRDWKAGVETLPIDKLWALYRIGWEDYHPARNLEPQLAARGASAIPFLKTKLAEANNGLMLMNLISLLEMMRDTGSYDPARDSELLALVDAAVARQKAPNDWNLESAKRLRNGTPHPLAALRAPKTIPLP